MTIDDAIFEELATTTAITAHVGARIYRGWRPQQSKVPCISFLRISTTPINGSLGPAGTENARIQVDVWAVSSREARTIANAVRDTLAGWLASDAGGSQLRVVSDQDMPVEPDEGGGQWEYRVSQDYSVWYAVS